MRQWPTRKDKHGRAFNMEANRNKHYWQMTHEKMDEKVKADMHRKPYEIVHRKKEEPGVDREKEG